MHTLQDMLSAGTLGRLWPAAVLGLLAALPQVADARVFQCRAGDASCLIAAVKQANVQQGQQHEIRLAAGVYTLTDWENDTDGLNGLPSITSRLTIRGMGDDVTIVERNSNAALFRLFHVAPTGQLTLYGLTLSGGVSSFAGGGGLFNAGGIVTIMNSTFIGNEGNAGGGLNSTGGMVTILNSTFADNVGGGGGLYIDSGATVTIDASTIAGNHGRFTAGGLLIGGATVRITNSAIVGNGAETNAGGVFSNGTLTITNSTIARNVAGQGTGGGILGGGTTRIINSTIVENHGSSGGMKLGYIGGVVGPVTLQNTIVAHNTSDEGPSDCGGAFSLGHNLIGDPTGCPMALLPSDLTGESGLGQLVDNGTPGYAHYPLLEGSLAIDAGNPAVCLRKDQLGQPRVGSCDIGAIEFQGPGLAAAAP